ncbi:Gfo/Idh/MocA family oxidoreductase [bacterium]|nr:Gfo/Idh/MocA family oxidoreductase [Verrucomicrobiota bacterium]MDC0262575.1 Gfo/Idh/MocA family oxidoreductase [bacterium]MDB4704877.1 Gfo/Idh/MocA family oxidoreductase [Verrucomicrobiota bacterium]MDB4744473.1 Gfo/Idh/MocA family oxidoreductase [Verrucomicrobiota bacterium]MDC0266840.1 Gfo/Idh/MocA family oxidoreductase [bacterium]
MISNLNISRRSFLRKAILTATATSTLPHWYQEELLAAPQTSSTASANGKPNVALIGCGGMGRYDARLASKFGNIVALCDLDQQRLSETRTKDFPKATLYDDFRKVVELDSIDAVICGTVDHWHTMVSIAAMRAGKDVYCEKPLTLTIDEGKRLVSTSKATSKILQTGSQQRSDARFRLACELVRNGRIGKVKKVKVFLPAGRNEGPFASSDVPKNLDWEFWKGQTPDVPYVKERTHGSFRYWYDYSGGTMTDWGAHHHDIVLWGLGLDRSGPISIEGKSKVSMIEGGFSAASEYKIHYNYANGVQHTTESTADDNPSGGLIREQGKRHGIMFEGTEGWIWVTRGKIKASDQDLLDTPLPSNAKRLYHSDNHMGNFFECISTRKQPICNVEIGHRSASVCHLGVIAMRLGRKLNWNPETERFINNEDANHWLARTMRRGWGYEFIA